MLGRQVPSLTNAGRVGLGAKRMLHMVCHAPAMSSMVVVETASGLVLRTEAELRRLYTHRIVASAGRSAFG